VILAESLPKTRSGKVLRRTLKAMVNGKPFKVSPTIMDESVIPVIHQTIKDAGLGVESNLKFDDEAEGEVKE